MYKILDETTVLRVSDNTSIPTDPENSDYQAYLGWLAEADSQEQPPEED